jgi:hypothetical protein
LILPVLKTGAGSIVFCWKNKKRRSVNSFRTDGSTLNTGAQNRSALFELFCREFESCLSESTAAKNLNFEALGFSLSKGLRSLEIPWFFDQKSFLTSFPGTP